MEQQTCSIVRDLLPLYEEHAVSLKTDEFVKQHLESCEECRNYRQAIMGEKNHLEKTKEQTTPETLHITAVAKRLKKRRRIIGSMVIASFLVISFIFSLVFNTSKIEGTSMEPTYGHGATVLINKAAYLLHGPKNNDLVALTFQDSGTWIKRVIAGPGDTVSYEDGYLLVNGTSKETAEWSGKTTEAGDQTYPIALSDEEYFVIGDSLDNSFDSRYKGCDIIRRSQINGKVLCRWLSLNSLFTRTSVATSSSSVRIE